MMAASDHLNPQQFMPTEELGHAESQYGPYGHRISAAEAYKDPQLRYSNDEDWATQYHGVSAEEHQRALSESVAEDGVKEPVVLGRNSWTGEPKSSGFTIYDGHHRYFAARDAGHTQVPVEWADE